VTVRDDDAGRENLCRYVLRHPISLSRHSLTTDGRIAYQMKYPRRGKTHLLMACAVSCASRQSGTPTASSVGQVRGRAIERVAMARARRAQTRGHQAPASTPERAATAGADQDHGRVVHACGGRKPHAVA
jgi:hypothetical protein